MSESLLSACAARLFGLAIKCALGNTLVRSGGAADALTLSAVVGLAAAGVRPALVAAAPVPMVAAAVVL